MSIYQPGQIFRIRGMTHLEKLQSIDESVTTIGIDSCDLDSLVFPAHVKKLILNKVTLTDPLIGQLREACVLEELALYNVTCAAPFSQWAYPPTLKLVTFADCFDRDLDLRGVTVPAIALVGLTPGGGRVFLPEALDELIVNSRGFSLSLGGAPPYAQKDVYNLVIPAKLRSLKLKAIFSLVVAPSVATIELRHLAINRVNRIETVDFFTHFPALESLYIKNQFFYEMPSLKLPRLRDLTITRCECTMPMVLSSPALESLKVINGYGSTTAINFCGVIPTIIASTLKTIELSNVTTFPLAEDWERLESVSMMLGDDHSLPKLPYIQWLKDLSLNEETSTNGYKIGDLAEYRQAWGMGSRKKGARSAV